MKSDVTLLSEEEKQGLIPEQVTTQAELNALEQLNIARALIWLMPTAKQVGEILDELFFKELHRRMFCEVWEWAGSYRTSDKNIGIAWYGITENLRQLTGDVCYQVEHSTFSAEEIVVRMHHRLVAIHPFANGNGRHARILSDYLLKNMTGQKLHWGGASSASLAEMGLIRKRYISALRLADRGDYTDLLAFAVGERNS